MLTRLGARSGWRFVHSIRLTVFVSLVAASIAAEPASAQNDPSPTSSAVIQYTELVPTSEGAKAPGLGKKTRGVLPTRAKRALTKQPPATANALALIATGSDYGAPATTNLLTNGGFEAGLSPWTTGAGAAITQSSTTTLLGMHSMRMAVTSTSQRWAITPATIVTAPSTAYTLSAWVKGEGVALLSINEYNGAAFLGNTDGAQVELTGGWQRISVTRTFGSTGNRAAAALVGATATTVAYMDGAQFEQARTHTGQPRSAQGSSMSGTLSATAAAAAPVTNSRMIGLLIALLAIVVTGRILARANRT